jgi:hypothetical protein
MPLLRLLLLLGILALPACTDPRKTMLARLRQAKVEEIRTDVARLHTQHFASRGPEFVPIRPEYWPESIQKLRPLRMTLYRDGLAIAIHDEPGVEFGIHVIPPGDIVPPKSTKMTRYELIQDGIYFYRQER